MLVIFEKASCPWCERLRGYLTPALGKYKDRLAVIRVTVGSSGTVQFAKDSQVTKYPTVFRYENGRKTQSIVGCPVEESGFISWFGVVASTSCPNRLKHMVRPTRVSETMAM